MLGSSVLPDLLETMHTVLARFTLPSNVLTWDGSVESSTCNSGNPGILPKVILSTSGPRLDPPMPSSRACEKPASWTSLAISRRCSICANWSSVIPSQPSQDDQLAHIEHLRDIAK